MVDQKQYKKVSSRIVAVRKRKNIIEEEINDKVFECHLGNKELQNVERISKALCTVI